jgi:SAM-dependent methyltransferase
MGKISIMVAEGRNRGLDIVGVEAFYGGSQAKEIAISKGLLNVSIFPLDENFKIPFPDNCFDLVVSNQVMEHVQDLSLTFMEINRVLKPNGRFLVLFPDKSVFREGTVAYLLCTGLARIVFGDTRICGLCGRSA